MEWSILYKKAIADDGTLYFPERLSQEFLDNARRTQGSYIFANQYQNEIIPSDVAPFKKEWIKYFKDLPSPRNRFAFIDPAISIEDGADYTAVVIVEVDVAGHWYVTAANRYRITPTEIVELVFKIHRDLAPLIIGIEEVAYQKALLYNIHEESKRRQVVVPVKGCKPPTTRTKETRILGLVPRFEWNRIFLTRGLNDLEIELLQFPRSSHDDLLDALAYMDTIVYYPSIRHEELQKPNTAADPNYERWFIHNLKQRESDHGSYGESDTGD